MKYPCPCCDKEIDEDAFMECPSCNELMCPECRTGDPCCESCTRRSEWEYENGDVDAKN